MLRFWLLALTASAAIAACSGGNAAPPTAAPSSSETEVTESAVAAQAAAQPRAEEDQGAAAENAPAEQAPDDDQADVAVRPAPGGVEQPAAEPRLASHLFVPVGESRSLAGLGELIEIIGIEGDGAFRVDGEALRAQAGGTACLRFAYRESDFENSTQTLCAVAFDETGDCGGLAPLELDLLRFLPGEAEPRGEANLLATGSGRFYAACRTGEGAYRLQQPREPLPPLFFNTVDALGDGAYSLGDSELGIQRAGVVTTFAGEEIRPPWLVTVGEEIEAIRLNGDATLRFGLTDCARSPACSFNAALLQPGDVLRLNVGADVRQFEAMLAGADETTLDRFFQPAELAWSEVAEVHPDAQLAAFARLAALEIMGGALERFDAILDLRGKDVIVAYWQPWFADRYVPGLCFPDAEEQHGCRRIEDAIATLEQERIAAWRAGGFRLWHAGGVDYRGEGEPVVFDRMRPHWRNFEGVLAGIGANSSVPVPDVPLTIRRTLEALASTIGGETPLIVFLHGPPITAQTGSEFCEAEICASDFTRAMQQSEAAFAAAIDAFSAEQLRGFAIALFEGSQFDIREPHEAFSGLALNRVGETGYNHPLLNVYRAR